MRDFQIVLRVGLRIWWRRASVRRWKGLLGLLPALVLIGGLGVAMGVGAFHLFGFLEGALVGRPELLKALELNILALYALITAVMVLVNALGTVYATIYESEDNAFFLSTPLRAGAVLAARLAAVCFGNVVAIAPPATAPFVAYGLARGVSGGYYVAVLGGYVAYVLSVVGLAALVTTLAVRFVPGPRLKRGAMILMLLCLLSFIFALNFVMFSLDTQGGPLPLLQRLANVRIGSLEIFPHVWLARVAIGAGTAEMAWLPLGALVLLAGLLLGVLIALAPALYLGGWASSQEAARTSRGHLAWTRYRAARRGSAPVRSSLQALFGKEMKIALRSPMFWYLLGVAPVGIGFSIAQFSQRHAAQEISTGRTALLLGMVLVGSSLSSLMFAGTSLSREGHILPLWLCWPIQPRAAFLSKVLAGLPVPLILAAVGLGVVSRFLPQGSFAPLLAPAALVITAVVSAVVALDTITPNYKTTENLMSSENSFAKVMSAYLGLVGIALLMVIFSFPGYYHRLPLVSGLTPGQAVVCGWGALAAVCAGITYGSFRLGTRAIGRLLSEGDPGSGA